MAIHSGEEMETAMWLANSTRVADTELTRLRLRDWKLTKLEEGGVDNWEGYSLAINAPDNK